MSKGNMCIYSLQVNQSRPPRRWMFARPAWCQINRMFVLRWDVDYKLWSSRTSFSVVKQHVSAWSAAPRLQLSFSNMLNGLLLSCWFGGNHLLPCCVFSLQSFFVVFFPCKHTKLPQLGICIGGVSWWLAYIHCCLRVHSIKGSRYECFSRSVLESRVRLTNSTDNTQTWLIIVRCWHNRPRYTIILTPTTVKITLERRNQTWISSK